MRTHYGRRRFFFPLFILLALLAVSFAVYWLWNNILVAVVPVKSVTYWQAMGLLTLSRILFGGFKFGPPAGRTPFGGRPDGTPNWREKLRHMSDEDRQKFRSEWKKRCGNKS